MSIPHVKYLLVGGGLASSAAAQAVRSLDPEGSLLLIGQEVNRPYHRPPLTKEYLRREKPRGELFTLPADWFEKNHVQLRTGRRAAHLDTARRAVTLDNGEEVSFDKLLIATGASPRPLDVPGAHLPNLLYLRTIEDAERLHHAIEKAKREGHAHDRGRGRVAMVGGGVIGVELAASLTQMGLCVDLVLSRDYPWDKFAGESTGRFLALYLQKHGVRLHPNAPARRLEGDGRVQRVVLAPGEVLPCDFAVACVGANVNKDVLRGTPVAVGKAILVDDHCRTNVPDVYAAGDCAAVFDPLFGKHRVMDHWDNAAGTGRLAGRNMAGADEAYRSTNTFFSNVFDLSVRAWGEARLVDRRLMRGTPKVEDVSAGFAEVGVASDGRVAQVIAVGDAREDGALHDLVARRFQVAGNEEAIRDPAAGLSDLFKASPE